MNVMNLIDTIMMFFFGGAILLFGIAAFVFFLLVAFAPEDRFY